MINNNWKYWNRLYIIILLIAPFIYLLPYTLPIGFKGFEFSIGNDFRILYYSYKVYILHFFSNLEFPLWSPSEAAGYPLYSNPFVQYFYPLNILLVVFYKVFGGYTVVDHIRFTVLGFSIFSAGIYVWLKAINIKPLTAFTSSLIVTLSIGSLEMLRFPNAVHTLCWFPFILYSISSIYNSEKHSQYIKYSVLLILFSLMSVTAGYPYYLYYFLILIIPYLLFYQIPFSRRQMFGNERIKVILPAIYFIVSSVIVIVISYPYLKSVFELVSLTTNRGGSSYEFSTASSESPLSTLGSLIYPPLSIINTSFYFGLLNLMIIFYYFLSKKGNETTDFRKWVLLIWIVIIIYITYGSGSLLFNLLWHYFPFFSNLREWGRLNKILLLLTAWVLALALERIFYAEEREEKKDSRNNNIIISVSILVLISITLFGLLKLNSIQWSEFFVNSKLEIIKIAIPAYVENFKLLFDYYWVIFAIISLLTTVIIVKYLISKKDNKYFGKKGIVFIVITLSLIEFYAFTPWLWLTGEQTGKREKIEVENTNGFNANRTLVYKTISTNNNFNAGIVADWYYKTYVDFLNNNSDDTLNLKKILGVSNNRKLFLSTSNNHKSLTSFFSDSDTIEAEIKIIKFTGDKLEVEINNEFDCYLNYIDNMDKHWKAFINDKEERIELLFGAFKSVKLGKGKNTVKFLFNPFK